MTNMMTLDEAIQHCEEKSCGNFECANFECANEHRQLAEWLKELKELRFQKEQMMKDAIDGEVNIWGSHISLPRVLPSEFSKQRVKVIIIKE